MPGPGLGTGEGMASVAVVVLRVSERTACHPKRGERRERRDGQRSQSITARRNIQLRMLSFVGGSVMGTIFWARRQHEGAQSEEGERAGAFWRRQWSGQMGP